MRVVSISQTHDLLFVRKYFQLDKFPSDLLEALCIYLFSLGSLSFDVRHVSWRLVLFFMCCNRCLFCDIFLQFVVSRVTSVDSELIDKQFDRT